MKEYKQGIYKNSGIRLVVIGFVLTIVVALILGWLFLRTGHPAMHTSPQPKDNRGSVTLSQVPSLG